MNEQLSLPLEWCLTPSALRRCEYMLIGSPSMYARNDALLATDTLPDHHAVGHLTRVIPR